MLCLCIDTLRGRSVEAISEGFKSGKTHYEFGNRRSVYVKANEATARDSSFRLLYIIIITAEFQDETKACQKIYHAVLFSYPTAPFPSTMRARL